MLSERFFNLAASCLACLCDPSRGAAPSCIADIWVFQDHDEISRITGAFAPLAGQAGASRRAYRA